MQNFLVAFQQPSYWIYLEVEYQTQQSTIGCASAHDDGLATIKTSLENSIETKCFGTGDIFIRNTETTALGVEVSGMIPENGDKLLQHTRLDSSTLFDSLS